MDNSQKVNLLLNTMHSLQISLPDFMLGLLSSTQYKHDPVVIGLASRIDEIIQAVMRHSEIGRRKVDDLASKIMTKTYMGEVVQLARHDGGLHFNVLDANIKQLEEFTIANLMQVAQQSAPLPPWGMLDDVLAAHTGLGEMQEAWRDEDSDANKPDMYWNALEGGNIRRARGQPTHQLDKQRAVETIVSSSESVYGQSFWG